MKHTKTRRILSALVALASASMVFQYGGCADLGTGGLSLDGLFVPYTSGMYGFPSYGLYDPTNDIQDVINYRLGAMETAASGWSDFILQ